MVSDRFQNILHLITYLNSSQLTKLHHDVALYMTDNKVKDSISEHDETITNCPHCDCHELSRWGMTKNGVQRFRCRSCKKTFNALVGSPLYCMKKPEIWIQYTNLMWDGVSIRKAANLLDINIKTSFRFRHLFIEAVISFLPSELAGGAMDNSSLPPEQFDIK
ncbi:MAG: IS1 family transposase [Colwellia sp.]|nr:IS1 family transposase [Colwellia sp.]